MKNGFEHEGSRGEIYGVLGANGSGKSTLIRLVSTLLTVEEGRVEVFGNDINRDEMAVKRLINRVSVDAAFFKKLSPHENLAYAARLYGIDVEKDIRPEGLQQSEANQALIEGRIDGPRLVGLVRIGLRRGHVVGVARTGGRSHRQQHRRRHHRERTLDMGGLRQS